uniref:insulin-like growth factor-binding protein 3 n=1 Tax=Podarcis muralis TaxID=64176 RepID=UPI00109FFCE6|nr:insulin-like growth factor-binding protein 3 [Podarcis muralis]
MCRAQPTQRQASDDRSKSPRPRGPTHQGNSMEITDCQIGTDTNSGFQQIEVCSDWVLKVVFMGRAPGFHGHWRGPTKAEECGNASNSEEDQNISSTENQSVSNTQRLLEPKSHAHHTKIDVIRKEHAKNTQRYKYDSQSTDTLNFSSESKQETEYGPCRREMEDTLNNLKILNVLSPRGLHIPNCDKKGFYKKKQCRPSRGRKRGYCWCVDKYGQRLPGYDGKGKGDVHCYNLESK